MRRWTIQVKPPSSRRRRYFPRRATSSMVRPASRRQNESAVSPCTSLGASGATQASTTRRPTIRGARSRRMVSTSGSSGIYPFRATKISSPGYFDP